MSAISLGIPWVPLVAWCALVRLQCLPRARRSVTHQLPAVDCLLGLGSGSLSLSLAGAVRTTRLQGHEWERRSLGRVLADHFTYPVADAKRYGRDPQRENKQFASRWTTLRFRSEIPEAERNVVLAPCGRCAAKWYGEVAAQVLAEGPPVKISDDALRTFPARVAPHAFQSAAGHTPAQAPRAVESATSPFPAPVVAHRQPPSAPGDLVGAPSCAPTAAAAQSSGQRFHQLSKLMAWKQQGLLSEDEFVKLKRELCS